MGLQRQKIMHCHLYGQKKNFTITQFWAKTASRGTYLTTVHMHYSQVPHRQLALTDRMLNSVSVCENLLNYDGFIKTASARAKLLPVLITILIADPCSPQSVIKTHNDLCRFTLLTAPSQSTLLFLTAHSQVINPSQDMSQHGGCKAACSRRLSAHSVLHADLQTQNSESLHDVEPEDPKI